MAGKPKLKQGQFCVTPIWPGRTVFIIGGGPSLNQQNLEPLKEQRVIGTNCAFKLGPEIVDILFFGDSAFWFMWEKCLRNWPGAIIAANDKKWVKFPSKVKRLTRSPHWSQKPDRIWFNGNTGYGAINLAGLLGAERIVLLGFDMKFAKDNTSHWHGEHPRPTLHRDLRDYLNRAKNMHKNAKKHGIELVNASADTDIPHQSIPQADYETILSEL